MSRHDVLYTPGSQNLGKETIRHNQDIEDQYNELISRQRELSTKFGAVNGEQNQILVNIGVLVASGAKYEKQTERLAALRSESEALEAGILYLNNQSDLLKRSNYWLKTR